MVYLYYVEDTHKVRHFVSVSKGLLAKPEHRNRTAHESPNSLLRERCNFDVICSLITRRFT
jgi:hypothetical protein